MINNFKNYLNFKIGSFLAFISRFQDLSFLRRRLLLVFVDCLIITLSILVVFFIKFDLNFFISLNNFSYLIFFACALYIPFYGLTGQYRSLSRYPSSVELYNIGLRNLLLLILSSFFAKKFNLIFLDYEFAFLLWFFISSGTVLIRLLIKDIIYFSKVKKNSKNIYIYGAGSAGVQLSLSLKISNGYNIRGFLDDNPELVNRSIDGIKIYNPKIVFKSKNIDQILLAIPSLEKEERLKIIKKIGETNIPLLEIPSIDDLTNGKAKINNLKPILIEELLGREPLKSDPAEFFTNIVNRVVLVTGGAGSIGSELCMQILNLNPKQLLIMDKNEHRLYSINEKLRQEFSSHQYVPILGSTLDMNLLEKTIKKYKVNCIFHAAAYKHVPLVEANPIQSLKNNVYSTKNICEIALKNDLDQVILISSDKAVRPTNIMGVSKRISELIIQAYANYSKNKIKNLSTKYSMVRFGNVLGSSGSVVPLFRKQIKLGGPITLTHPKVIRYFMTISEAVQLVIYTSNLSEGGEVFLLDMGKPISIKDLAEKMIKLSGLSVKNKNNPNGDIEIKTIGLRPGEKLFEELLIGKESFPTKHPLIFRANERFIELDFLEEKLKELSNYLDKYSYDETMLLISELVPEWKKNLVR